ncbi:berberine bridge enzyme-like 22 [Punica granatum]|uniref:Berberine bridge enzyme-like 22 n=1 Tax=Punica granatum TaxID=22663 RepID=A0A6P8E394_PUNGR|nr:berberine bridge enzyme-like 22 [Punica granatum]
MRKMIRCLSFIHVLLLSVSCFASGTARGDFAQCMSAQLTPHMDPFTVIHSSKSSSYSYLLESSQQNPRWVNSTATKPLFIITPLHESQVQAAVLCSRAHGLQIRVRSGGHDYEGLSYLCGTLFVLIDLVNLRLVEINMTDETAWVQSGATLGELYYGIAKESQVHGFPAGLCPSVGVGGHLSGGGFGTMLRKYGLAADNVVDAYLIDVNGRVHDRKSMGEDLFWAIRGGGGASFGIVLAWKIKLVRVPPTMTVFTIPKWLDQGAIELVHRWQFIADKLPEELFIRVIIQKVSDGKAAQSIFNSLFLGKAESLIPLMDQNFPELGLKATDCTEMSWIQSVMYFAGYQKGEGLEVLLDRTTQYKSNFKAKSDYVKEPIPETGLKGIWDRISEEKIAFVIMDPYGGRMSEISESELPFPNRKGNLYNIQYLVKWEQNDARETNKHVHWIRMLYRYMTPYVSKSPRSAYVNYRDLDLGMSASGNGSYLRASIWGPKYFKNNWKRLGMVKQVADPENFFRNEQSIPPYVAAGQRYK